MRGRRLAFDYGDVRTGVAICDPDAILSSPLTTLMSKSNNFFDEIVALIQEHEIVQIYVGLPKHMSGISGEGVEKVSSFVETLEQLTQVPITLIDERLSTVFAQKKLFDAGLGVRESAHHIDAMAAVAILEQGLARDSKG